MKHLSSKIMVLIVEDEDELREVLEAKLSKFCDHVILSSNGFEALELIHQLSFDLIISDIRMPKMDGVRFLNLIRKDSSIAQPRFLFMTGGADLDEDILTHIQQNTDGVLQKPFKDEVLFQKIQEMFPDKIYEKTLKLKA